MDVLVLPDSPLASLEYTEHEWMRDAFGFLKPQLQRIDNSYTNVFGPSFPLKRGTAYLAISGNGATGASTCNATRETGEPKPPNNCSTGACTWRPRRCAAEGASRERAALRVTWSGSVALLPNPGYFQGGGRLLTSSASWTPPYTGHSPDTNNGTNYSANSDYSTSTTEKRREAWVEYREGATPRKLGAANI
jgi:hypothetical protein